jgi:hypothetical protein|tara:strand:+ start:2713 stop:2967 length:255 start_codon:yes stop_codon:yes gene_type:complete
MSREKIPSGATYPLTIEQEDLHNYLLLMKRMLKDWHDELDDMLAYNPTDGFKYELSANVQHIQAIYKAVEAQEKQFDSEMGVQF